MHPPRSIRALFSLPGFVAAAELKGVFGDRLSRVLVLRRQKKRQSARAAITAAVAGTTGFTDDYDAGLAAVCAWPLVHVSASSLRCESTT